MRDFDAMGRRLGLAVATFAGFFLLGYGGIFVWSGADHSVTPIWPATAFGMIMLLRLSRGPADDAAMLAAILAGGFLANALAGAPPVFSTGFSLINIVDVVAAVFAVRRLGAGRIRDARSALRFGLTAGISPALFGALLSAALLHATGGDGLQAGLQWFFANLLGVCILFPFGMTVSWRRLRKLELKHQLLPAMGFLAAIAALALVTFHEQYPVMFLVLAGTIAAGARFRLMGAGAALIIVGSIAFATVRTVPQAHNLPWVEVLQFFLAVCSLTSVGAALLMNQRDLHLAIIERQRRRAVRASRFKSQLMAHVSHEVRSPLSAIIGFSSMLESGTLPVDKAPEFAAIIAHNGELLRRLHDDLLDLARAEAGALSIAAETVPLGRSLKTCVDAIRMDASLAGKDVLIESVDEALAVRADPVRLAQILNNLIANAFKYGDTFSPIRVRAARLADGFGRIEVVNAGPGIPAGERLGVFLPFRRSGAVGRDIPGAGLGLSIAKMLAEAQGGRIDFESVPGRQTRFWVDLPLAA